MIPIEPIGPGASRIERPSGAKRVQRAPKRSRDEPGREPPPSRVDIDGEDEDEDGEERPRIDLRA